MVDSRIVLCPSSARPTKTTVGIAARAVKVHYAIDIGRGFVVCLNQPPQMKRWGLGPPEMGRREVRVGGLLMTAQPPTAVFAGWWPARSKPQPASVAADRGLAVWAPQRRP